MEKLKEHIWSIWKTSEMCHLSLESTRYLNKPRSKEEFDFIKKSIYLRNIARSLWAICIIDLHKITSESSKDKISLRKLINKLKNKQYKDHNIPSDKIDNWEMLLIENQTIIENLKIYRDKRYAHLETGFEDLKDIYFKDIEDILYIIDVVVSDIYNHAFDTDVDLKHRFRKHNGQKEIRALVDHHNIQRSERLDSFFKKK